MNKRKIIIYAGAVAFIVLTAWAILLVSGGHKKQNPPNTTISTSETGPVSLKNTENLSNILLQKQFNTLLYVLSDFIQKKVDASASSASIIGSPTINTDGSITFRVLLNTSKRQSFAVNVDRSVFDHLTVSVPDYQYTKSISVY